MNNLFLDLFRKIFNYLKFKRDRERLYRQIEEGLTIGKNVYIGENVDFDDNFPFLISIGDNCRISKNVRFLAHDATSFRDLGITKIAPVKILEGCYFGERAQILPGVTIGPRTMVAAGAVVNRDIGEGLIVAGNPARPYKKFSDVLANIETDAKEKTIFFIEDIEKGKVSSKIIKETVEKEKVAYVGGIPEYDPYYVNYDKKKLKIKSLELMNKILNGKYL